MALNWEWKDKCGEATWIQTDGNGNETEYTISLYTGNATLIMLHEFEEDGVEKYDLFGFWADKQHMKNCLGLNKKEGYTKNMYDQPSQRFTKFRINKAKCRYYKDIIPALAEAFDMISIEVFNEK